MYMLRLYFFQFCPLTPVPQYNLHILEHVHFVCCVSSAVEARPSGPPVFHHIDLFGLPCVLFLCCIWSTIWHIALIGTMQHRQSVMLLCVSFSCRLLQADNSDRSKGPCQEIKPLNLPSYNAGNAFATPETGHAWATVFASWEVHDIFLNVYRIFCSKWSYFVLAMRQQLASWQTSWMTARRFAWVVQFDEVYEAVHVSLRGTFYICFIFDRN